MATDDDKTRTHMTLTGGTMVSHYRIIEKIGAGGMGEVYLAEDTELNRKVALKFLPLHLCQDPECRARFKREAQAAAKLDHPNIVSVFEVGEFQGQPFFSMQHVEGQSLKVVIEDETLPLNRVLEIAIQLCEGLQAAHQKSVTHRDIKPSNILIDPSGRVRIVDFGLASVMGTDQLTKTGSTIGTVGYMSPEQARGEKVDARTDLFSLGVVLYELIAGRSPFKAESDIATIKNITEATPEPLARYKAKISDELQRIVSKTLIKDRNLRYQHADEILADLKRETEALSLISGPHVVVAASMYPRRWLRAAAIVLTIIIALAAVYWFVTGRPSEYVVAKKRQVTFAGDAIMPEISSDGNYLAYVRRSLSEGLRTVLVQDLLAGGPPIKVFEDKGIWDLRWSPDGSELLMTAINDSVSSMVLVPRLGGSFRRYDIFGAGSAWSPDGKKFALVSVGRIYFVDKKSGDTSSIPADSSLYCIDWSPNGELLALSIVGDSGSYISAYNIRNHTTQRVTDSLKAASPQWSSTGEAIYFMEDKGENPPDIYKVHVNPHTGKPKSKPIRLISSLQGGEYSYSIGEDCGKMAVRQRISSSNLWLARMDKQEDGKVKTKQLTSGTTQMYESSISPDGSQVAFAMRQQDEVHIFTMPIEGGAPAQLTHAGNGNRWPFWSPDGRKIAYVSGYKEKLKVAVIDAKGGGLKFIESPEYLDYLTWYPGEQILCVVWRNAVLLDPENGAAERLLTQDINGFLTSPCYSPDGQRVALIMTQYEGEWQSRGRMKKELAIFSVEEHSRLWSAQPDPGTVLLGWSPDGEWLYMTTSDTAETTISRMRIADAEKETVIVLPWSDVFDIVMGPDCSTFVCVRRQGQSDIWLIEDFDPEVR